MSAIEWCESTWNPVVGCSIVSTECKHCYAMLMARRLELMKQEKYNGLTEIVNGNVVWNGVVRLHRPSLGIPFDTKKPTLWFVNSMSDLFHHSLPDHELLDVWNHMVMADWHRYQVLTKRPVRMRRFAEYWNGRKHPHIWLGTSVGYKPAKDRILDLRETNAAVRFLSCEPLLEDLGELDLSGIHWVIIGGESGPGSRPMQQEWARNIVRQCKEQNVKVFVKQMGRDSSLYKHPKGGDMNEWPEDLRVREMPA